MPPVGQTVPHVPQLLVSLESVTQRPPHTVCPLGHVHVPETHEAPTAHVVPHAPQLAVLVFVSTQLDPHCV